VPEQSFLSYSVCPPEVAFGCEYSTGRTPNLPKSKQQGPEWQTAVEAMLLTGQRDLTMAVNEARRNGLQSVSMRPVGEMGYVAYQTTDRPVRVSGFYGAENAVVKEFELVIDKAKLLQMFCDAHSIE
jgi:hypothetical protein